MTPPKQMIVLYGVGMLIVAATLAWQLRGWLRNRAARRVTPETGLRPGAGTRRKADWRFRIVAGVLVAIGIGVGLLQALGSDETRQRIGAVDALLARVMTGVGALAVVLVVLLLVLLWLGRDPVLKEVAQLALAERHAEAIDRMMRHIAERGPTTKRLNVLGAVYLETKQWDAAMEQFRQAEAESRTAAERADARHNQALVLCRMGRTDEALALMTEIVGQRPDDFTVACNHASLLADAGREVEAYEALERAERILDRFEPRYVPDYWRSQIEELRRKLPTARGFPVITGTPSPPPQG